VFLGTIGLICILTAVGLLLREDMPWSAPDASGPVSLPDNQEQNRDPAPALNMPRAETGTGVTVPVKAAEGEKLSYTQVYEKNQQSIVTIRAVDPKGVGEGTGIVLTADGYIITNAHVIEGATWAEVVLNNDLSYQAKLVGISPEEDLAVLKVEATDLIPAEFGDSFSVKVGDEVSALGNPLGYRMTLTPGIISSVDRELNVDGNTMHLLQTSAPINFGNSGGALFNDRGQVIGVTAVKIVTEDGSTEGLGFAIPMERVKYVVDHLIAGEELRVPMLGITVQQSHQRIGLEVMEVQDWSDARNTGIQVGDLIIRANGYSTTINRDLERVKNLQRVGEELVLDILRGDKTLTVRVKLSDGAPSYP
jgi:S1-C subfamily serine protease